MINILKILCAAGVAVACGGSGPITIPNPMAYLSSPSRAVRLDVGRYQATTSYQLDDTHAVTAWNYPPFQTYDPAKGDGGEQYVLEGDTVRIEGTRDGGLPYNQYFTGKGCGGTGWVLFRLDAAAEWHELVARLAGTTDPGQCQVGSAAYTRYQKVEVGFPVLGVREAIISEHFSSESLSQSTEMERSFFVAGYGRVAWQSYSSVRRPSGDVATRCPNFGWSWPVNKMQVVDCRVSVEPSPEPAGDLWRLGR